MLCSTLKLVSNLERSRKVSNLEGLLVRMQSLQEMAMSPYSIAGAKLELK